ncbi:hypothetical protein RYA05_28310 [Pseudomonas syringae pv. actinidiae]|nr:MULTISPECIES: hypothetical protein [Pseudomonas syringae group]EPN65095.1 hypothetical protein A234_34616 [Pseudomonas syringae pv. actinidiae ICMP 19101]EPN74068.1 hypothetical protein A235_00115 [Pseudomonas syringae pv. actinidiae ICMP 19079]MBL3870603.1 hypothetical protein [Pseudomonas syringae pv. theae]AKT33635.1 hypothetical protein IYO_029720 [Pseudomonas syringae pv. actinidiae ICMP 18884]AOE60194.1 hypothetical protein NZ708_29595 [Pseudomonas syringae pv. actinidiae ICMP 18708]
MKETLWRAFAVIVSRPCVAAWIIRRAQRTPYQHITSADGQERYMGRWWLFEGYDRVRQQPKHRWFPWSVRVHHILREDRDRDLHDHPWHARTIILQGEYVEQRLIMINTHGQVTERIERRTGTCAALRPGEYHRIDQVAAGGAYTLFITRPKSCDWGFLVNGVKVPWDVYTADDSASFESSKVAGDK